MKIDSNANIINVKSIAPFKSFGGPESIIQYGNSNLICTGQLFDSLLNANVPAIIQIDTSGQLMRTLMLPDTGFSNIQCIKPAMNGGILFTEHVYLNGIRTERLCLLDSLFNYQTLAQHQPSWGTNTSCIQGSDSLFYFSYSGNGELIEKIDSNGNVLWSASIPVSNLEIYLSGLKINWNNEVVIGGWSGDGVHSSHNTFLATVIDTMNFTSVEGIINSDESRFSVFPNPSTGLITVTYTINGDAKGYIEIISPLGEKLLTNLLNSNVNSIQMNLSDFKPSIYFYKIVVNDEVMEKGTLSIVR
jgi:hypothetical protein